MNEQMPPATKSFIKAIEGLSDAKQMAIFLLLVEHTSSLYFAQEFEKTHKSAKKLVDMCWDWLEKKRENLDQIDLWFHQGEEFNPLEIELSRLAKNEQAMNAYQICSLFIGCVVYRCYQIMNREAQSSIVGDMCVLEEQLEDVDIGEFFSPEILHFLGLSKINNEPTSQT